MIPLDLVRTDDSVPGSLGGEAGDRLVEPLGIGFEEREVGALLEDDVAAPSGAVSRCTRRGRSGSTGRGGRRRRAPGSGASAAPGCGRSSPARRRSASPSRAASGARPGSRGRRTAEPGSRSAPRLKASSASGQRAREVVEVAAQLLLGHRPRELGRPRQLERPVHQHEPADAAAAAGQVLERDRAAHRPADERHVVERRASRARSRGRRRGTPKSYGPRRACRTRPCRGCRSDHPEPRISAAAGVPDPVRPLPAVDEHDRRSRAAIAQP